jgi:hypothetical protein
MRRIDYIAYCIVHTVLAAQVLRIRGHWFSLVDLYYISPLHNLYGKHKGSLCHALRSVAFNIRTQTSRASVIILVTHKESLDTP